MNKDFMEKSWWDLGVDITRKAYNTEKLLCWKRRTLVRQDSSTNGTGVSWFVSLTSTKLWSTLIENPLGQILHILTTSNWRGRTLSQMVGWKIVAKESNEKLVVVIESVSADRLLFKPTWSLFSSRRARGSRSSGISELWAWKLPSTEGRPGRTVRSCLDWMWRASPLSIG